MFASPQRSSIAALPFAASLLLSGCSWFGWAHQPSFSYARLPVPRAASQPGATQQKVVRAGGNPSSVWMVRNGSGVCYNYLLTHGSEHRLYYVVFDAHGVVTHHGFSSCMEADRHGDLR
ncbi:outer membrane protein assembly factor BamE [Burkholderia glumae]|uniref:Outer membrane protein assembly factor BamE n=1 Tax=Burkholderia glumae TaxID=337 RepID=A0AAQ0BQU5_BURGL|nr:outer membrane protein assembly factor BamE [Burkholderia glumae]ACR32104.1 Osmotically-inducible lipoprotein OsmE [Burkholderia glumae BGR1]AJY63964.1 smpA / OmlA family protein [Burkholderia glumae LMG 2196 = ATCC 33617]KHJ61404.1 lipoprotein [Burkholderia glumae]MCM2484717.1 outer membrane protein assembly factor BamE [Burkholderia glumae]MCM2495100.1 outer membrane protein assembly factor BamE [Burkholderia glumae]